MTKYSWVLLITTFVGSLLGGMLAERLFDRGVVHAQKANGVNAEEFLLLDQAGRARAGLGLDMNGEVGLVLTSRDGFRMALDISAYSLIPLTRGAMPLMETRGGGSVLTGAISSVIFMRVNPEREGGQNDAQASRGQ